MGRKSRGKKDQGAQRSAPTPAAAAKTGDVVDQFDEDVHQAWSLAANSVLYEADPGPAQVNIGTKAEPVMVSKQESWRISYARHLLTDLDGDLARINAAGAECIRRAAQGGGKDYTVGADLCRRAAFIIEQAGAAGDERVRRRLVAVAERDNHLATFAMMGMGADSSMAAEANADLEAELRAIGGPDPLGGLDALTALTRGHSTAVPAPPVPSPDRILVTFPPAPFGPRVTKLLVDEATRAMLGEETLAEVATSLWALDCQTCGKALGANPPALKLQPLPQDHLLAGLHHDGCVPTTADWTSPRGAGLAVHQQHNTWTSRSMLMPLLNGEVYEQRAVLFINPGLENVHLARGEDGRWRVNVAADLAHLGLSIPNQSPDIFEPIARMVGRVTDATIAATIQDPPPQTYETPAEPEIRAAAREFDGLFLAASHTLWLDGPLDGETVGKVLSSDRVRVGWVALHGSAAARSRPAPAPGTTYVLHWNPRGLTVGTLRGHTTDALDAQKAQAWAEGILGEGAEHLIGWTHFEKSHPGEGWFTVDAISTAMYCLRPHGDGWRLVHAHARHGFANTYTDNEAKSWAAGILETRFGLGPLTWTPGPATSGSVALYATT